MTTYVKDETDNLFHPIMAATKALEIVATMWHVSNQISNTGTFVPFDQYLNYARELSNMSSDGATLEELVEKFNTYSL